jgi:hypothetical protein
MSLNEKFGVGASSSEVASEVDGVGIEVDEQATRSRKRFFFHVCKRFKLMHNHEQVQKIS